MQFSFSVYFSTGSERNKGVGCEKAESMYVRTTVTMQRPEWTDGTEEPDREKEMKNIDDGARQTDRDFREIINN